MRILSRFAVLGCNSILRSGSLLVVLYRKQGRRGMCCDVPVAQLLMGCGSQRSGAAEGNRTAAAASQGHQPSSLPRQQAPTGSMHMGARGFARAGAGPGHFTSAPSFDLASFFAT
jgi:hypothetical protein